MQRTTNSAPGAVHTAPGAGPAEPGAASELLKVSNLSVVYGTKAGPLPAVHDFSLTVRRGEILGIVGESGSGKSTVLAALMNMLPSGAIRVADEMNFDGTNLLSLSEARMRRLRGQKIGLVPQRPMSSLSPTTSVRKQLRLLTGGRVDDKEMDDLLASVGLGGIRDRLDDYPFRFSGGQLQRMLIAIAILANEPDLVLADEPTTTLDPTVQSQILSLMMRLRDRLNNSMIFVSHDLAVISQVCDRVGVMYGGQLVEIAPVEELFAAPQHPYTRALLEAMPRWRGRDEPLRGIEGSVTGSQLLPGCPFAPRCARADSGCHESMPAPTFIDKTMVRCFYPGEQH